MMMTFAAVFSPSTAVAQEQAPLRMSLLNVSASGGGQPRDQLVEILSDNEAIELIDAEDVRSMMANFGVNDKLLRVSELRTKRRTRITRLMQAQGVEGLIIIDVYSKGKKLQVVVLGPDGTQLKSIKRNISKARITRKQGLDILQEVFPVLGPEVLEFRQQQQSNVAVVEEPVDPVEEEVPFDEEFDGPIGGEDPEDQKPEDPEPTPGGYFQRGITLGAGAFFGSRAMEVSEVNNNNPDAIKHTTQLVGLNAQVDITLASFGKSNNSAVVLVGDLAYAPFETWFDKDGDKQKQPGEQFASSFLDGGGQLGYRQMIGSQARFGVYGGAEYIILRISALAKDRATRNADYTGNEYTALRAGAELGYDFSKTAQLLLNGGLLPVLSADNSGGALGESDTSLGYHAGARLQINFTENLHASASYKFRTLSPKFENPPAADEATSGSRINSSAESTDTIHGGTVMIGLSF